MDLLIPIELDFIHKHLRKLGVILSPPEIDWKEARLGFV